MKNTDNIYILNTLIAKQQWDKMADENWETLLAALNEKRDWEQMWRLVQVAPAIWSVQILLRLKEAAWRPEQEAEREAFTQLVQLAEECRLGEDDTPVGRVYCEATLEELSGGVDFIAINPDGQVLTSWSKDNAVRLWSLSDGKVLKTQRLRIWEYSAVNCIAISPDGQMLASGETEYRKDLGGAAFALGITCA